MSTDIRKEIELYKQSNLKNIEGVRKAVEWEQVASRQQHPLEVQKYNEFKKANKGKQFVKLSHINDLGLEYDVLMFISNKNIGKTTNIIYNRFRYYRDRGQKVIFGRVTKEEVTASATSYEESPQCPFKFKAKGSGLFLYDKETNEEYGRCVSFRQCNAISAGEFHGYGAIIFDEIFTWSPMKLVNAAVLDNFFAFPSSIQRNKEQNIKIYMLGNTTGRNDDLLEALGIRPDDNFRYIVRPNPKNPKKVCRILYINARDIYRGITDQDGAAQMANQQAKFALNTNAPLERNLNKLRKDLYEKMPFKFSFIMGVLRGHSILQTLKEDEGILKFEIRGFGDPDLNYAIDVCRFDPTIPTDGTIYTECPALAAKYGRFVKRTSSIDVFKEQIYLMMLSNKLDFTSKLSYDGAYYLFTELEKEKEYIL